MSHTNPVLYDFIAVEGNIGAGKTTLARRLAVETGAVFVPERFEDNPFLPGFYAEPGAYAFPLELSFLEDRYRQLAEELEPGRRLVSDYYFAKSGIFAGVTLGGEQLRLFSRFYGHLAARVRMPDLVIYLHRDRERLQENIRSRGREYEQDIDPVYLGKIETAYRTHFADIHAFPVLLLDSSDYDAERLFLLADQLVRKRHANGLTRIV